MKLSIISWWPRAACVLTVLCVSAVPVQAAGLGFKSNIPIPIIVQGATSVNNMLRRSTPFTVLPGKLGWDLNLKPGTRFITIYDARQPARVLWQGPIIFQGRDMLFSIQTAPRNPAQLLVVPLTP